MTTRPQPLQAATEVVYVIGGAATAHAKIGRSRQPAKRLADIQSMSPAPLEILWSTPGGSELEAALHRELAPCRAHGEWFDFAGQDPVSMVEKACGDLAARAAEPAKRAKWRPPEPDPEASAAANLVGRAAILVVEGIPDPLERTVAARNAVAARRSAWGLPRSAHRRGVLCRHRQVVRCLTAVHPAGNPAGRLSRRRRARFRHQDPAPDPVRPRSLTPGDAVARPAAVQSAKETEMSTELPPAQHMAQRAVHRRVESTRETLARDANYLADETARYAARITDGPDAGGANRIAQGALQLAALAARLDGMAEAASYLEA